MQYINEGTAYATVSGRAAAISRERKLQTLRAWWPQLTDEDWIRIAGQRKILRDVVQEKYGFTPEIAQQEVERCFSELNKIF